MTAGFVAVLLTQFCSALADNALLFAVIAHMKTLELPAWQVPVLQQSFVMAFIVLAPFVGHLADAMPKGRVMFVSNSVKVLGCGSLLAGVQPLLAYAWVGVGAAMYSPAKYGILSELFPAERLVWANGWMEGITVVATILGVVTGGALVGERMERFIARYLAHWPLPPAFDTTAEIAIAVILFGYLVAALIPLWIPRLPVSAVIAYGGAHGLAKEFIQSCKLVWKDELGRLSLVVTGLLWGIATTLRFVILAWSAAALRFDLERGARLTALVIVGVGLGAAWAGWRVRLADAVGVLKVGTILGLAVAAIALVTDWRIAVPQLLVIGAMGGYLLVPMNALLQHRGQIVMGAGHSIALQNLVENGSILLMLGLYAVVVRLNVPADVTIGALGMFIAISALWSGRGRIRGTG